jgi:two-component system chemotaxis sensor kinase CheA
VRIRNIGGATVLGDGRVVLMLNPVDLLRSVSTREAGQWVVPKQAPRARPRVLLADDSLTTRALERSVLETAGFEVVAVADGAEAFGMLDQHPDFDAVVSDVSMPRLDGIELCQRIRASERLRGLPVILVTSLGSDADRQRGLAAGADAYVVKSEFDHEKLVAEVNLLLGRM